MDYLERLLDKKDFTDRLYDNQFAAAIVMMSKLDLSPIAHIIRNPNCHSFYLMWRDTKETILYGIWSDNLSTNKLPKNVVLEQFDLPDGRTMISHKKLTTFTRDFDGLVKAVQRKINMDDSIGIFVYEDTESERRMEWTYEVCGLDK